MLKLLVASLCLASAVPAFAAATAQQNLMKECNTKAAGKKGPDRKAFMSSCLKGEEMAPAAATSPQQRMKDCNTKAAGKKGAERKAFMSQCLKG